MKGISTMLAAILLVAFTVAVGGIISVWMTGFTRTATSGIESATTNQTKCAGAYLKFDRVTSTSALYSNPSSEDMTSIRIVHGNGTTIVSGLSLSKAEANSTVLDRGSNTAIYAYGLCRYSVPVEGSCKSGDSCWV